jgi:hypothetical protein
MDQIEPAGISLLKASRSTPPCPRGLQLLQERPSTISANNASAAAAKSLVSPIGTVRLPRGLRAGGFFCFSTQLWNSERLIVVARKNTPAGGDMTERSTETARIIPPGSRPLPIVERAFQLARRGHNSAQIRELLRAEGYEVGAVSSHMGSAKLCRDLNKVAERLDRDAGYGGAASPNDATR